MKVNYEAVHGEEVLDILETKVYVSVNGGTPHFKVDAENGLLTAVILGTPDATLTFNRLRTRLKGRRIVRAFASKVYPKLTETVDRLMVDFVGP